MATRISTRTDEASGDFRRKRTQAPSAMRGGTVRAAPVQRSTSPVPRQRSHALGPGFAAAAAVGARDAHRHAQRHDAAVARLALRQRHLGAQHVRRRRARRERRRACDRRQLPTDGKSIAISSAKHSYDIEGPLTIGADPALVKATRRVLPFRTRIMPATKECPMCDGTMVLQARARRSRACRAMPKTRPVHTRMGVP